jgi:hypothetical protein
MDAALVRQSFLFSPSSVSGLLEDLPNLRERVGSPVREGVNSDAYPGARRTERQIYRILSNTHYKHLRQLLRSIDRCISRGFVPPKLLTTRSRSQFDSRLAEVGVAEHLLRNGYQLEAMEHVGRVPEFLARGHGHELAVEVYRPRSREGIDELMDSLQDAIKNLDEPFDYSFDVSVKQLEQFDANQKLLTIHPQTLSRGLNPAARDAIVLPLVEDVIEQLRQGAIQVHAEVSDSDLNVKGRVDLSAVTHSTVDLPARRGPISEPGMTGHAPEAMFDDLVRNRVRGKLRDAQASNSAQASSSTVGTLSVLVVDLGHFREVTTPITADWYKTEYLESLNRHLGRGLGGYDFACFSERVFSGDFVTHFFLSDTTAPVEVIDSVALNVCGFEKGSLSSPS